MVSCDTADTRPRIASGVWSWISDERTYTETMSAAPATASAATLLAAAPMVSPYVPVYDLVPLVPATILLAIAAHRAALAFACAPVMTSKATTPWYLSAAASAGP